MRGRRPWMERPSQNAARLCAAADLLRGTCCARPRSQQILDTPGASRAAAAWPAAAGACGARRCGRRRRRLAVACGGRWPTAPPPRPMNYAPRHHRPARRPRRVRRATWCPRLCSDRDLRARGRPGVSIGRSPLPRAPQTSLSRTYLDRGDAQAAVLEQHADTAGRDALAQTANHATSDQHILHGCRATLLLRRAWLPSDRWRARRWRPQRRQ
jgi:hypothetical protein